LAFAFFDYVYRVDLVSLLVAVKFFLRKKGPRKVDADGKASRPACLATPYRSPFPTLPIPRQKTDSSSLEILTGKNCWLSSTPVGAIVSASSAPGRPAGGNEKCMKKTGHKSTEPEMREDYDFTGGVRGKYARRYAQGTNVVVLEPDVAEVFPNAEAVNRSLRALAGIMREQNKKLAAK